MWFQRRRFFKKFTDGRRTPIAHTGELKKGCTRLAGDKVYQLLSHGRWFSPGIPASPTTKTGRHDIAEIFLKLVLHTMNQQSIYCCAFFPSQMFWIIKGVGSWCLTPLSTTIKEIIHFCSKVTSL